MQASDKVIPKAQSMYGFDNSSVVTKGEVVLATFAEGVIKDTKFQIKIDPVDEEKTLFITDKGTYCYKVMPFGLKNTGATYQRLVTKIFQEHLGKTLELYIDDMLDKSTQTGDHFQHLSEIFEILHKYNMKLNQEKYAFGVASVLKKQNQFEWTDECQQALKDLKMYLSNRPLLAKPKDRERFLIYLAVSEVAVSAILVREDKGLELAQELGIEQIVIKSDSQLVVNQMQGTYVARDTNAAIPQKLANGQAESTNKVIISNFKKRLEESKDKWLEVLPGVLWAYGTTSKTSTDETPFSLVCGTEALIPLQIGEPSTRYTHTTEAINEEELRVNLDLTEERREAALIRMVAQKQMIEQYSNRKANLRYFKIWDFVFKKVFWSTKMANVGKLSPNWESPYTVRDIVGK
ncbi:uncharacterized protein [Nicotiana tomentosiformis]|uniref:uncharacterized protein n=1 Tax=Nicotiana tomentosiformis TaxID=4098 RepID=UPI00388CB9B3